MQSIREFLEKNVLKSSSKNMEPSEKDPLLSSQSESHSTISTSDSDKREIQSAQGGPDGVRAWFIAFLIFFINFIIVGESRVAGILYVHFVNKYHMGRKLASAPYSIQQSTRNLFGPIVGILGQKYGVRFVSIIGAVIVTVSCVSCYFAEDIIWITVMWGALYGIGTAFSCTVNQVLLDEYFVKYRTSASGFAFSGGSAGAIFFPPLLEMLAEDYGIEGSFLILGAICLFVIPAAILLRKPPWINENNIYVNITGANSSYKAEDSSGYSSSNLSSDAENCIKSTREGLTTSFKKMMENVNKFSPYLVENTKSALCEERISYEFLRQNNNLVLKLLTMEIPVKKKGNLLCPCEKEQSYLMCPDETYVAHELEQMYCNLEQPLEKSQGFILRIKEEIRQLEEEQRKLSIFLVKNGNSNYRKKCIKFADIHNVTISEIQCDANTAKCYCQVPKELYIPLKLRELCQEELSNTLLRFFDQFLASKLLIELKKLNELFRDNEWRGAAIICPIHSCSSKLQSTCFSYNDEANHKSQSNSFWDHIGTAVVLHKNLLFLLVCLCRCVYMLTFTPVLTCVVDFAMDKGMKAKDGKYVIDALSVGDLFGRLCLGWLTDKGFLSLAKYMLLMMVLLGANTAILPFIYSRELLLLGLFLFSSLQGSLFIRHPVIISRYLKDHEQFIGLGFINFSSGLLAFALPAFIGYFRDFQGSYDNMFYLNGAISVVVGLLWAAEPFLLKSPRQEADNFV